MDGGLDVGAVEVRGVVGVRVEAGITVLVDVVGIEFTAYRSRVIVVVCCVVGIADAEAFGVVDDIGKTFGCVCATTVEVALSRDVPRWWWRRRAAFEVYARGVAGNNDGP